MANLNLSPNLFLEVNELKRFRDGIEKDGYKVFVKYIAILTDSCYTQSNLTEGVNAWIRCRL